MIDKTRREVFFHLSLPLFILNSMSFIMMTLSFFKKRTLINTYFMIVAFVMLAVYCIYYYSYFVRKKHYSEFVTIFMCVYTYIFFYMADIAYIVSYILFAFCMVQIILGFNFKGILITGNVFITLFVCLGLHKVIYSSTPVFVDKQPGQEIYLILFVIIAGILLSILYVVTNYINRKEKKRTQLEREKRFNLACKKKGISPKEKVILSLMLQEINKNEMVRISGFTSSNVNNKIASIKSKLKLLLYQDVEKAAIEKKLYN